MKKIPISNFKKKYGQDNFKYVTDILNKSDIKLTHERNSTININRIVQNLPETEVKTKFLKWSSGYDFAVMDII